MTRAAAAGAAAWAARARPAGEAAAAAAAMTARTQADLEADVIVLAALELERHARAHHVSFTHNAVSVEVVGIPHRVHLRHKAGTVGTAQSRHDRHGRHSRHAGGSASYALRQWASAWRQAACRHGQSAPVEGEMNTGQPAVEEDASFELHHSLRRREGAGHLEGSSERTRRVRPHRVALSKPAPSQR
eukprot:scaffold75923_cov48-Phaeocystis_antarctica.AAC.2